MLSRTSDQPLLRHEVANFICQIRVVVMQQVCRRFFWFVSFTDSRWETNKSRSFVPVSSCYCASIHTRHVCKKWRSQGLRSQAAVLPLPHPAQAVLCISAAGYCDWNRDVLWQASSCSDGLDMPCLQRVPRMRWHNLALKSYMKFSDVSISYACDAGWRVAG